MHDQKRVGGKLVGRLGRPPGASRFEGRLDGSLIVVGNQREWNFPRWVSLFYFNDNYAPRHKFPDLPAIDNATLGSWTK